MFKDLFRSLAENVPGFRAAAVVGSDGIEIDSHVVESLPHEVLSAELNGTLRNLDRMKVEAGIGELQEVVIRTGAENILMLRLSDELFVLMITSAGEATGRARYEVQRLAHRFLEVIQ